MAATEGHGDLTAHEGTYARFLSLLKAGTAISLALAAIVVLLIAR